MKAGIEIRGGEHTYTSGRGEVWRGQFQKGDIICVPENDGYRIAFFDHYSQMAFYGDVARPIEEGWRASYFHMLGPKALKHVEEWHPTIEAIVELLRPYLRTPDEIVQVNP